ncbi:MAG: hypothetical protein ACI9MK_001105, partial [Oceanospirillaceae bacterium]
MNTTALGMISPWSSIAVLSSQEHRARQILVSLMAKKQRRKTSSAITSTPALKTASLKLKR